jgi:hypothetical protein
MTKKPSKLAPVLRVLKNIAEQISAIQKSMKDEELEFFNRMSEFSSRMHKIEELLSWHGKNVESQAHSLTILVEWMKQQLSKPKRKPRGRKSKR